MGTQSYITIKNALEQFADNHLSLRRFKTSFFEQIDNFSSGDNTFPILYAIPSDVTFDEYTNRFFFRVYIVDVLQKDRSNESAILNDTLLILRDLYNWLKISDNGLNVLSTSRAIPVNNFLVDYTTGWYLDVEIEGLAESNDCSIPFSENFILTGYTCDYSYVNQFLTCETLEQCQAIIDINDRIDGIIISADTFVVNGSYDNPSGTLSLVRNDGNLLNITGFTTGATGGDIYVTGGTFNNLTQTLTLGRNDNQSVVITGFTSSSGGTGIDVFVTGGTYSNGSIEFTNNTGGTFTVTGIPTGSTSGGTVSWGSITGTLSNQTDLNNALDGKADISGDTFTGLLGANNGFNFTANDGDVTQIVRSGNADLLLSHSGSGDIVISKSGSGTILQDATEFQEDITVPDEAYGPSWDGSEEVPTKNAIYDKIESLTGGTDVFVTGGTYSAGTAVFTNNTGGTFSVSGFSTGGGGGTDVFVTGGTFDSGAATLELTNNTGGTFSVTGVSTTSGSGSGVIAKSVVIGSASTPSVETVIDTIFIPANTFTVGDIWKIVSWGRKSALGLNWTWRVYTNTTNTLTGANNIARGNTNNPSFGYVSYERTFFIESSATTRGSRVEIVTGYYTDFGGFQIQDANYTIDWTVDQYILITATTGGAETVSSYGYIIEKY